MHFADAIPFVIFINTGIRRRRLADDPTAGKLDCAA